MKVKYYGMFVFCISVLFVFYNCDEINNLNKAAGVEDLFMSIKKPANGDKIVINQHCMIQWNKEDGNTVKIELLKNGNVTKAIAGKTGNNGAYYWDTVSEIPGVMYQIRITLVDGPYEGQYSESNNFIIKEEFTGQVSAPAHGDIYEMGDKCEINWDIEYGDYVKIELVYGNQSREINGKTENDGTYIWKTYSESQNPGDDYRICISPIDGPNVDDVCVSGLFGIKNSWEYLGYDFSGEARCPAIAVCENDIIYLLFQDVEDGINRLKSHLKRWIGDRWEDCGYVSDDYSFYFSTALTQSQNPMIVYSQLDIEKYKSIYVREWNGTSWTTAEEIQDKQDNDGYPIGLSVAIDGDNNLVCSFLSINIKNTDTMVLLTAFHTLTIDELLAQYVRVYLRVIRKSKDGKYWEDLGTNTGDTDFIIGGKYIEELNADIVKTVAMEYANGLLTFDDRINYDTSMALDSAGNPHIAYIDNTTDTNSVKVITYSGGQWEILGDYVSDTESMYVSLAISEDIPFVVYTDLAENKTRVKKYTGSEWEEIGTFNATIESRPSIIIDCDNKPVVACSDGVQKFNGTGWDNLGWPNWNKGTGHPSWWIDTNSSFIAVAFLDDDNRVCVKRRYK